MPSTRSNKKVKGESKDPSASKAAQNTSQCPWPWRPEEEKIWGQQILASQGEIIDIDRSLHVSRLGAHHNANHLARGLHELSDDEFGLAMRRRLGLETPKSATSTSTNTPSTSPKKATHIAQVGKINSKKNHNKSATPTVKINSNSSYMNDKRLVALRKSRENEPDLSHKQRLLRLRQQEERQDSAAAADSSPLLLWTKVNEAHFKRLIQRDNRQLRKGVKQGVGVGATPSNTVVPSPQCGQSPSALVVKYTVFYYQWTIRSTEYLEIASKMPVMSKERIEAKEHSEWSEYFADQASLAAHHFRNTPTVPAPFDLPPLPPLAAAASIMGTCEEPPYSLQRYVQLSENQFVVPEHREAAHRATTQVIAKAVQEGTLYTTNWDTVALVSLPDTVAVTTWYEYIVDEISADDFDDDFGFGEEAAKYGFTPDEAEILLDLDIYPWDKKAHGVLVKLKKRR